MKNQILIIEDDTSLHAVLSSVAVELGHGSQLVVNGAEGLQLALKDGYIAVLLDLNLPGLDGMSVCKEIRAKKPHLPIVILTGQNDKPSEILALDLGADDYVAKPFSFPELVARIRTVIRRADEVNRSPSGGTNSVAIGEISIDAARREVRKSGNLLQLTRTEYDVLHYLFSRPGVVVSREELLEQVWGYNCSGFDSTITAYLSRIRSKIENDPDRPLYLKTLRGVGYRFISPQECATAKPG